MTRTDLEVVLWYTLRAGTMRPCEREKLLALAPHQSKGRMQWCRHPHDGQRQSTAQYGTNKIYKENESMR